MNEPHVSQEARRLDRSSPLLPVFGSCGEASPDGTGKGSQNVDFVVVGFYRLPASSASRTRAVAGFEDRSQPNRRPPKSADWHKRTGLSTKQR